MPLYLDHYVRPDGVDPRSPTHRVRHVAIDGMLGGMTIAEALREAKKDVFRPAHERTYVLRVLISPEDA
jgi:hypothetical protein